MRKAFRLFMAAALLCLLTTGVVQAREMIQGENCTIAAGRVVEGSLLAFCQNLQIEGRVEGNLIGIGLRASISGEIGQNVYLAGLELDVTGTIQRDLHYVGLTLNVLGTRAQPIGGQLIFAALSSQVDASVHIPHQVIGIGYQFIVNGAIDGEVSYWGSAFALNNTIKGDVYANVGNPESDASDLETLLLPLDIELKAAVPGLTIDRNGRIDGDLSYSGPVEGNILGNVKGEVQYHSTTPAIIQTVPDEGALNHFLDRFLREIAVLFTVGLLGLALASNPFQSPLTAVRWRPFSSLVIGMLLFILSFPIALMLLLLTTIIILILALLQLEGVLIVAASLLALIDVGVIGVFYFTAIFVARAVIAMGAGRLILRLLFGQESPNHMKVLSLATGVIALAILTSLPVVGFVLNAGALFLGLGAIATVTANWLHSFRAGNYASTRSPAVNRGDADDAMQDTRDSEPPTNAPMLPASRELGLADLPQGFDPDFFFSDD